ncbi:TIGR01777 family protein [Gammaproteobacteria bacterium 45_16_T64]|nr:TIGR01777 family protein [Gammaproteobacteria bacterium 45_16_T64]
MNTVLTLVVIQALMGAFDTLYHHELKVCLPGKKSAQLELKIHGVRSVIYAFLFMILAWVQLKGGFTILLASILVVEIILTLWDFVIEDQTRLLPPLERITHTLLAINYGVILAFLLPEMAGWYKAPAGVELTFYGWQSLVMTLFSVGVLISGAKDWQRSSRLPNDYLSLSELGRYVSAQKKSILVTGGTGFIGKRLVQVLVHLGHDVMILTRNIPAAARELSGKITFVTHLSQLDEHQRINVIVNLAGEPLASGRWTEKRKQLFVSSRVNVTQQIVELVDRLEIPPDVLINGSAIGFYGPQKNNILDECGEPIKSFSHELCQQWENKALEVEAKGVRVCLLRIGIVLGQDGGPLAQLRLPFEFGCAMGIGDGSQWMSWIHRDDLIGMIIHTMGCLELDGPINATAPHPVTNNQFSEGLKKYLPTYLSVNVPAAPLRVAVGEMAEEVLITGQRVVPVKIQRHGFNFTYESLDNALAHLVGRT